MAINVNTVYQTVLLILNKEQRGYMTPLEFNKTATQAQLEIFENYFDSLNQQIRIPQTNTDYADRIVNLDEKISIFKTQSSALAYNLAFQFFSLPAQYSGAITVSENIDATAATTYTLQTITAAQVAAGISSVFIGANYETNIEIASTDYTLVGNVLTLATAPTPGQVITIQITPEQFYRLGSVLYSAGGNIFPQEIERVTKSELRLLNSSNLTKPTTTYPVYTYGNNKLTVYPLGPAPGIVSGITVDYVRKPLNPLWFFTGGATQYVYQASASTNFEIHSADQTELILKILLYAGVVIKDPQIIQVAAQQVAQENSNQQR